MTILKYYLILSDSPSFKKLCYHQYQNIRKENESSILIKFAIVKWGSSLLEEKLFPEEEEINIIVKLLDPY